MQKQAEKSARVAQLEDSARVTNVANKQHAIRPSKLTRYKFHQVVPPPNTVPIQSYPPTICRVDEVGTWG